MKILLLEDDMLLSEVITEQLKYYKYDVSSTYTGLEAEDLFYRDQFDLLLLDVNVPGVSGFNFLKDLRHLGNKTPAIFITSLNTPADVLKGFEIGANDYLKKPFDMLELIARIENIKRHFHIDEKQKYHLSDTVTFDALNHTLMILEKEHKLSKKEVEILHYFVQHKNNVVSHEDLSTNLWSYEESPSPATIRSYIKSLRKILGKEYIENIRGVGYRFS